MSKVNLLLLSGLLLAAFFAIAPERANSLALPMVVVVPFFFIRRSKKRAGDDPVVSAAAGRTAGHAARLRIPREAPRRESPLINEAVGKIKYLRTMGDLIRKPSLRTRITDICDFADVVVETIRRMPTDTPSAGDFVVTSLEQFRDAMDRFFELSRGEDKSLVASDDFDVECFGAFITVFRKQQEKILSESLSSD